MNWKFVLAAVTAAMVVLAGPAGATLQIAADIGGTTFLCVDQTGCDINLTPGVLQVSDQVINGVEVNGSIQTSTKGVSNILNTSSLSLINNSGADKAITFTVSDTGFVGPVTQFVTAGSGTWENAGGSTITLEWFNSAANAQGATFPGDTPGSLIDSFSDTAVGAADAFSHSGSGAVVDGALFSMTEQASGTLVDGGSLINRGQTEIKLQEVPEPGSLALLGGALLSTAWIMRRRRQW